MLVSVQHGIYIGNIWDSVLELLSDLVNYMYPGPVILLGEGVPSSLVSIFIFFFI